LRKSHVIHLEAIYPDMPRGIEARTTLFDKGGVYGNMLNTTSLPNGKAPNAFARINSPSSAPSRFASCDLPARISLDAYIFFSNLFHTN
jgi:hypothetical protein